MILFGFVFQLIFVGFWKLFCSNFALSLDVILNTFQDFAWVLWGRLEVLWGSFGGPLGGYWGSRGVLWESCPWGLLRESLGASTASWTLRVRFSGIVQESSGGRLVQF